ncbi:hypothetical protein BDZ97DRAFT_1929891 [Flammula alnicola]|nr:hypothetical protein BDZ97DRAFT_1929891 [Flammula alnicola]
MATSNPDSSFLTLTRHETYYISGGDLFILVDHIQFKVHRYFFERESKFFSTKLATPVSAGSPLQGSGDSNAIILENVTADQFATFLWVFYNPKYSLYEAPVEDWEVILALANRWSFDEVKSLAIRELEKKEMPDVQRIKLYHENNVDRNFLIPRYAALCEREEPLSLSEGMDLGMETTLMIARGREEARSSRLASGARSPQTPTIHGADLHEVIRELFQIASPGTDSEAQATTTGITTGALKKPLKQPTVIPLVRQPPPIHTTQETAPKTPTTKKGKQATPTVQQSTKATKKLATPTLATPLVPTLPPSSPESKIKQTTNPASVEAEAAVAAQRKGDEGFGASATGNGTGPAAEPPLVALDTTTADATTGADGDSASSLFSFSTGQTSNAGQNPSLLGDASPINWD